MKYRLSLDLGVSSIGSAVTALNHDNAATEILNGAVRIFSVSEGAEARRLKRQARKNNLRTKKRLKQLAVKLHEKGFWMSESPASPENPNKHPPYNLSPYAIRAHAIRGKLNHPHELGRALLHMAKHRGAGFIDAMSATAEEEAVEITEEKPGKKQKKLSSYELLPKYMQESGAATIGEYFHMRLKQAPGKGRVVRQRQNLVKEKPVDYAIPRYLVKDEFHRIWDKQATYYPVLQDAVFKQVIHDILFYERPSAPFATANCIYVDGEKRLLKAHPLFQMRRIYEAANNIRLLTDGNKSRLTKDQRDSIITEILMQGRNANKTSVRKTLGFGREIDVVFSDDGEDNGGIKPYLYSKEEFTSLPAFANMTDEKLAELAQFMAEPVNESDKLKRLYNENELIARLQERLQIDDEKQIGDLLARLPKGRSMLGATATQKILKLLKNGIPDNETPSHREATDYLVHSGDDRFKAEEVLAQEIQGKYAFLPYYGEILKKDTQPVHPWQKERNKTLNPDELKYGKIANPAVHRMLNQLRLVVNDIIRIYGRPYEINVELGREVGMSAKKQAQHEKEQKQNQKANDEAADYLKDKKIRITRENILKYKLAKEQHWQDAFNPQARIHPRFEGFEIEHLIPQAAGGTDTPANLVLVDRRENAVKGNQYPYEYFTHSKQPEHIREILKAARANLSANKNWRFEPDAREQFEEGGDADETNRYLTDTRYMAKLAARYLRAILDFDKAEGSDVTNTRILTVKGAHTAKLRTAWNLDGLEYELMGLDVPRYLNCSPYWMDEETGEIKDGAQEPEVDGKWKFYDQKKNPEWKKKPRIDHRHHALDAITLSCINRNFSSLLNWADKRGYTLSNSAYPLPLAGMDEKNAKTERGKFRQQVLELLMVTKVSHKVEHAKNGELHKGTGKAVLKLDEAYADKTITRYNRKVMAVLKQKSDLSKLLIHPAIKSEWHEDIAADRERLEQLKAAFELYYNEAEQRLEERNQQWKEEGKKEKALSEAMILAEAFRIIKENGLWSGEKFPEYKNEQSLIIIDKHKIAYTSGNNHRVDFYEKDGKVCWQVISNFNANNPAFLPDSRKAGCKPIWSVCQGDLIELVNTEPLKEDIRKKFNQKKITRLTFNQWEYFTDMKPCIVRIKKFSDRINIAFHPDSRMDSPPKDSPKYMEIQDLGRGLEIYGKCNARKVELTPAGKIKKKHKKLWHGKKAAA